MVGKVAANNYHWGIGKQSTHKNGDKNADDLGPRWKFMWIVGFPTGSWAMLICPWWKSLRCLNPYENGPISQELAIPPLDSMFPYEKLSFRLGISHGIAMFDEGYLFFPRMPMNIFARGWPQPKNTIVSPWHILEIRIEAEKFEEISWGFCKLTSNMISSKKNVPKNIAVFRKAKNVFLSKIETRGWPILSRTWEMFIRKRIWSTIKMVRLLVGAVGVMEQTWQEPTKIGI